MSVLGHTLHKHSSLLNEMLRVVEVGFKHSLLVQVAAYSSLRVLINNFSINLELVLTQQRRLNLLLMPLLASAVNDKHEQVEVARLQIWWHLIGKVKRHFQSGLHSISSILSWSRSKARLECTSIYPG